MSTYTDLHNRVRENVTVDYRTRETNQPLKLKSEQNEYWGTFNGTLSARNIAVNGGRFFDITSYNETLIDAKLSSSEGLVIDLGELGNEIQGISAKADRALGETAGLRVDVGYLSGAIDSVCSASSAIISGLDDFEERTRLALSCLSDMVSAEASARTDHIRQVSSFLFQKIEADVAGEAASRESYDKLLKSDICAETSARISAVAEESKSAREYADMVRHYALFADSAAGLEYPIRTKDFCVNLLTALTVQDGAVIDPNNGNARVGSISMLDSAGKTVRFTVAKNVPDAYRKALPPGSSFDFKPNSVWEIRTGYNVTCTWTDGRPQFHVFPHETDFYSVYDQFEYHAAKVTGYKAEGGRIISGYYTSESTNPVLAAFNAIQYQYFDNGACSSIQCPGLPDCVVEFLGGEGNNFQYRIGKDLFQFVTLSGSSPKEQMGRIFQKDVLSSSVGLDRFSIELSGRASKVDLLSSNGFYAELGQEERVSCHSDPENFIIDRYADRRYFEYGFCNEAQLTGDQLCGTVRLTEPRVAISDDFRCDVVAMIQNAISGVPGAAALEYRLTLDPSSGEWRTSLSTQTDVIRVRFDKRELGIRAYSITEERKCLDKIYSVRQTSPSVWMDNSVHQVSDPVRFAYDQSMPAAVVNAHSVLSSRGSDGFDLETATGAGDSAFTVQIPDATEQQKLSSVMREALYVIRPNSEDKLSSLVEVKFVDGQMRPVRFFNNRQDKLFVPVNKYTAFSMQEVNRDKFLLTDLNQNQQEWKLDWLKDNLLGLSGQVSCVSAFLSSEIGKNTARIKDIYKQLSGGLCYKDTFTLNPPSVGEIYNDTLSGLFFNNLYSKPEYEQDAQRIKGLPLRNGFYYVMQYPEHKSQVCCIGGLSVQHGDWLIIRDNCRVSSLTSAFVAVADMMDTDVFHLSSPNVVNGNNVFYGRQDFRDIVTVASADVVDISARHLTVSGEGSRLDVKTSAFVDSLIGNSVSACALSAQPDSIYIADSGNRTLKDLSDDIQTQIADISSDLYRNVGSGDLSTRGLSGKVEFLLSSDRKSMCYGATLPNREVSEFRESYTLSDFLSETFSEDAFFKTGFMFRLSGDQKFVPPHAYGETVSSFIFGKNDYFIVNKDVIAKNVTSDDIDIIYDPSEEAYRISADLSTKFEYLSSQLSDYHNTLSGIDRGYDSSVRPDNLMLTDMKPTAEGMARDRYYLRVLSGTLVLSPIA